MAHIVFLQKYFILKHSHRHLLVQLNTEDTFLWRLHIVCSTKEIEFAPLPPINLISLLIRVLRCFMLNSYQLHKLAEKECVH